MINLYALKYFVDSVQLKSMSSAATLNGVTRPAVSQAIAKLEEQLGTRLLEHKKRSFLLTQEAFELVRLAEPLFEQLKELNQELKNPLRPLRGDFKIGSSRTLATFLLPQVMREMKQKYPFVNFQITMSNSAELTRQLERKEIDLAFFVGDEFLDKFAHTVVARGYFSLVFPKGKKKKDLPVALTERRPETERLRSLYKRKYDRELPVFAEVHSWDAIHTWAQLGVAGALVPDFMLSSKTKTVSKLQVDIPKVFPYEIKVMHSGKKVNSELFAEFTNLSKKFSQS